MVERVEEAMDIEKGIAEKLFIEEGKYL